MEDGLHSPKGNHLNFDSPGYESNGSNLYSRTILSSHEAYKNTEGDLDI